MLSFFPRGVLDEILNLIESVSEGFPSYSLVYTVLLFLYSELQIRGVTEDNSKINFLISQGKHML